MSPAGRPRTAVGPPTAIVTERIRQLVLAAHRGNVREASRTTGIPYPTLNDLFAGRTSNPSLRTLEQLVAPYGIEVSWLIDPERSPVVPAEGWLGLLPPRDPAARRRDLRAVLIPFAAWPLYGLTVQFVDWLDAVPANDSRPVVGEATGDAFTFRLTTFLLQPLLAAERLGQTVILAVDADDPRLPAGKDTARWIECLRSLGEMWTVVLGTKPFA